MKQYHDTSAVERAARLSDVKARAAAADPVAANATAPSDTLAEVGRSGAVKLPDGTYHSF